MPVIDISLLKFVFSKPKEKELKIVCLRQAPSFANINVKNLSIKLPLLFDFDFALHTFAPSKKIYLYG
jgi:hypothetical protein